MARRFAWRILPVLRRAAAGTALLCVFVGASSSSAFVLHLDLPAGRRFAAQMLAGFLSDLFLGNFEISGFSKLSATRFVAAEIRVKDPQGRLVLKVNELRAQLDTLDMVSRLLGSEQRVTLIVPHIRIERAEAYIIPNKDGVLSIARAFELEPKPSSGREPSSPSARVVRVWLSKIELGTGFARGRVGSLPTLEADVSGARGEVLITPEGVSVDVPRFATAWRGFAGADVAGIGSFHLRGDRHFWSSFDGYFGGLQLNTVIRLQDGKLDITADVPQAEPVAVRALWPDWPVQGVADAHVEAKGTPAHLDTVAELRVGPTKVDARGVTRLSGDVGVDLDVEAQSVDLRAIWPDAPPSSVDGFTTLSIWDSPNGIAAELNGSTEPTPIGGIDVPGLDFTGTVDSKGVFEARATAHEQGMPLKVDLTVRPGGIIEVEARARRFRLEKAPRVQAFVRASGGADLTLKGRLEKKNLDATLSGDINDLKLSGLSLRRGHLEARARGQIDKPKELLIDARLNGSDFAGFDRQYGSIKAEARGPVLAPQISAALSHSDGPDINAKGRVSFVGPPRVTGLELALQSGGADVQARAEHVTVAEDRIEIKDLSLIGAGGKLEGSLLITPRLVTIEARGQDVDLDLLSRYAGLPRGRLGGKLDIDADVTLAEDVQRGHVQLELERGSVQGVSGLQLALEATLDERHVTGSARAELAGIAQGATQFDVNLPGPAAEPRSWKRATGRIEFRLDNAELSPLVHVMPKDANIAKIEGQLTGQVIVTREEPDDLPSLTVLAATRGLVIAQKPDAQGKPGLELQGVQAQLGTHIEGPSGEIDATLRLTDEQGALISASGRTSLPLTEIVQHPERAEAEVSRAALLGKIVIEERALESLPTPFRPKAMHGVLRAEATLGGSLQSPLIAAKGSLEKFALGSSTQVVPVDLCVQLNYSHDTADVMLGGEAYLAGGAVCTGRRVARLRSSGKLNIGAPAEREGPPHVFSGDAGLLLEGLPLEAIAPLGQNGIRGEAHGVIALEQGKDLPQLNARLELKKVRVEAVSVGDGKLNVRSDGKALRAVATFDQGEGKLESELNASLAWQGIAPSLDRTNPLLLEARAQKVDSVMLLPALRDVFSDLSGPIDGRLRMQLEPDEAGEHWRGDVSGELAMTGGGMQFNGLGMRLDDVAFTAKTRTQGPRTVIEVRGLTATSRARSKNISASGDVYLEHLELVRAHVNVNMNDVPIQIQGVTQANATGLAFFEIVPTEDEMRVDVRLPNLKAELPPSSGRNVLSLDNNRAIDVVQPLSEPRKRKQQQGDAKPKVWRLRFRQLGVKVVRSDLDVPISGDAVISLDDETTVTGTIRLKPGGRAQYFGKTFVIENGEILFDTGDSANPRVRILASWRAPDNTMVYLKISGTYRQAKLDVDSDPQLSDQEIYALLLGGSAGQESGSATATGVGLGAGVLGELLSDTPLRNVEIRTASEQTVDERTYSTYTAAMQLSDEIWFEGSYKTLNNSEPAQENQAVSGTIDWRFRRDWSLRTEVGTIGAGLDLLWTYHY